MAQGSKETYSSKQKRQVEHIKNSEKKAGKSKAVSTRIAWATVNKETGGDAKSKSSKHARS